MTTRIPLVPAAPADGKTYVQVNGQWVEPPKATPTSDGAFTKEDKAALDALVASGGGTSDDWISEIGGSIILLDADGKAILTPQEETIHFAHIAEERSARSITNPTFVQEVGLVSMNNNSYNTKTVVAGGLEFGYSGTTKDGFLRFRRYPNCNAPTAGEGSNFAESQLSLSSAPTYNEGGNGNYKTFGYAQWQNTTLTLTGTAYQRVKFTIYSRSMTHPHRWEVEMFTSGSSQLNIYVQYFGPRYDHN